MYGLYHIDAKRKISSANQVLYVSGALHPDRIMTEHDLVYIIDGSWEIYQNDRAYMVQAGDVIFLHAGQHHYSLRVCEPHTKTMFIHVNNDIEDVFATNGCLDEKANTLKINTLIHCQKNYAVKNLFQDIISLLWSKAPIKESKISVLFQLLLCELYECNEAGNSSEIEISEKAVQIIQLNPQVFFTAKNLAEQLFVSERTLRNKFIKVYNQTIYQYQMDTKLQKACVFLKDHPQMRLREIAANLGFYDEFHFSKAFKKHYGVSPMKFKI